MAVLVAGVVVVVFFFIVVEEEETVEEGGIVKKVGVLLLLLLLGSSCCSYGGIHELEEIATVAVRTLGMGKRNRDQINAHVTFMAPVCVYLPLHLFFFFGLRKPSSHSGVGGASGAVHAARCLVLGLLASLPHDSGREDILSLSLNYFLPTFFFS